MTKKDQINVAKRTSMIFLQGDDGILPFRKSSGKKSNLKRVLKN